MGVLSPSLWLKTHFLALECFYFHAIPKLYLLLFSSHCLYFFILFFFSPGVHISISKPSEFLFLSPAIPKFTVWTLTLVNYSGYFYIIQIAILWSSKNWIQSYFSLISPSILNTAPENLPCILIFGHVKEKLTWLSGAILLTIFCILLYFWSPLCSLLIFSRTLRLICYPENRNITLSGFIVSFYFLNNVIKMYNT